MTLQVEDITVQIVNHAAASGWFDYVNTVEPDTAPGRGLSAAVWVNSIGPAAGASGLQATSGLLVFNVRIYTNVLSEPQDAIDPQVLSATDALLSAYSGDFELGGQVRNVDLLGQTGTALSARAGYLKVSGADYRVMTITLPLIINDIWSQSP